MLHETRHHTEGLNSIASAATIAFIGADPSTTKAIAAAGKSRPAQAIQYGFEELLNKLEDNDFRRFLGMSTEIDLGPLQHYSTKEFLAAVEDGNLSPSEKWRVRDFVIKAAYYFQKENATKALDLDEASKLVAEVDGVSFRSEGVVDYWRGADGIARQTSPDSHYTEKILDAYGREIGNGAAGMSLGGHLRAIADALGLDGQFGIQGTYARDGEGDGDDRSTSPTSSPRPKERPDWIGHDKPYDHSNEDKGDLSGKGSNGNSQSISQHPILLDLNGNGIEITALDKSTRFVVDEDGLKHRTAWAGVGDGVLFVDVDGNGDISNAHEYVFTEWDASADDDMEALRAAFDTNADGKLTSADARFGLFRVLVTNADGSTTAQTLTALGITEIDLRPDTTRIELPDGSVITGQTTFVINGTTRTSANVALMAEVRGATVTDAISGTTTRTVVSTGRGETGDTLFIVKSETTESRGSAVKSWDRGGRRAVCWRCPTMGRGYGCNDSNGLRAGVNRAFRFG